MEQRRLWPGHRGPGEKIPSQLTDEEIQQDGDFSGPYFTDDENVDELDFEAGFAGSDLITVEEDHIRSFANLTS